MHEHIGTHGKYSPFHHYTLATHLPQLAVHHLLIFYIIIELDGSTIEVAQDKFPFVLCLIRYLQGTKYESLKRPIILSIIAPWIKEKVVVANVEYGASRDKPDKSTRIPQKHHDPKLDFLTT